MAELSPERVAELRRLLGFRPEDRPLTGWDVMAALDVCKILNEAVERILREAPRYRGPL